MEQAIKGFMASMFPLSFFNLSPAFPFSPLKSPHLVQDVCFRLWLWEFSNSSMLYLARKHTHTCWEITWPPVASGCFTYWIIQFREQHWRYSHTQMKHNTEFSCPWATRQSGQVYFYIFILRVCYFCYYYWSLLRHASLFLILQVLWIWANS